MDRKREYGESILKGINGYDSGRVCFLNQREWLDKKQDLGLDEVFLYHIQEITFEEKAPRREAMENILGGFREIEGYNFIYMILGESDHVDFYFGVAKDKASKKQSRFSAADIAEDILEPSIRGNFRGSKVEQVSPEQKKSILARLGSVKRYGVLDGVPGSLLEQNKDESNFQGVDRLIDIMFGSKFGLVVVVHPQSDEEMVQLQNNLCEVYDALTPLTKYTMQKNSSTSDSKTNNENYSESTQVNDSVQDSSAYAKSFIKNETTDDRNDNSTQVQASKTVSGNDQTSIIKRWNDTEVESDSGRDWRKDKTGGTDHSTDKVTSYNDTSNSSRTDTIGHSESSSKTTTHNDTNTVNHNSSSSNTYSESRGSTSSVVNSSNEAIMEELEGGRKNASYWLDYIDKVLLPRIDNGRGKGLFTSSIYLFSHDNRATLWRLANTAGALFTPEKGNEAPLKFYELDESNNSNFKYALQNLQLPRVKYDKGMDGELSILKSRAYAKEFTYCANWYSAQEVAVVAGLPQKEVIGLSLRKEVEFGLNLDKNIGTANKINLGSLVQCGEPKKGINFALDRENLNKHIFVAGVTGSGKTTTCQKLLLESKAPFLVIEPAKTEYRMLKHRIKDLLVFTPGRQDLAPFYLNPFELFPGESITSRADMLKATMQASFDMDAAIPQILEAAIYRAYEEKDWNIGDNTWNPNGIEKDPFADGVYAFPTLSDFVKATIIIVNEQGFDSRLRDEYIGSINARLKGLLVGAKGMMLNTHRSVDFAKLIERPVVIELEEIKSGVEKSLLMGFILTNLLEAIKYKHSKNPQFQHITLVEEAHRLLSNYAPGDSMNKKQGVEVFTDMLAEVRKYNESLIVVDQIPNKMTPEVLKNTNTKIVHKLFAQDDKDVIGNTMALEKEQKEFLSNLVPGRAIVFTQGLGKAIQVQMTNEEVGAQEVSIEDIRRIAENYYKDNYKRGILRGLEYSKNVTIEDIRNYLHLQRSDQLLAEYLKYKLMDESTAKDILNKILPKVIQTAQRSLNYAGKKSLLVQYLYWNTNKKFDEFQYTKYENFVEAISKKEANIDEVFKIWRKITSNVDTNI